MFSNIYDYEQSIIFSSNKKISVYSFCIKHCNMAQSSFLAKLNFAKESHRSYSKS